MNDYNFKKTFYQFGRVVYGKIIKDKKTKKNKGFGIIQFSDIKSAVKAMKKKDNIFCEGNKLIISYHNYMKNNNEKAEEKEEIISNGERNNFIKNDKNIKTEDNEKDEKNSWSTYKHNNSKDDNSYISDGYISLRDKAKSRSRSRSINKSRNDSNNGNRSKKSISKANNVEDDYDW